MGQTRIGMRGGIRRMDPRWRAPADDISRMEGRQESRGRGFGSAPGKLINEEPGLLLHERERARSSTVMLSYPGRAPAPQTPSKACVYAAPRLSTLEVSDNRSMSSISPLPRDLSLEAACGIRNLANLGDRNPCHFGTAVAGFCRRSDLIAAKRTFLVERAWDSLSSNLAEEFASM
jgi:hypothetical protein